MNFKKPYTRDEYIKFFQNDFLPSDFQQKNEIIDIHSFKPQIITQSTIIGEVKSLADIKIYEIRHKSENDARVGITKEICKMMLSYGVNKSICILTSPNSKNYRLSLVTIDFELDEKKVIKKYSNPKRYSFYLGEEAKTVTPEQFLIKKGIIKDFEDLKNRFSIEIVNKEFYNKIATLFTKLVGGKRKIGSVEQDERGILRLPEKLDHHKLQEFAVRLIGRIMFCWFLKKKYSESGIPLIDDRILSKDIISNYKNYYHECLERLFFEVLNTTQNKRKKEINSSIFKNVPFLNGGLFEPHKEDFNNDDRVAIPNKWFSEFFEILETYNFTIDENTSVDVELSIEPEMLGRIFENLLAEINPVTGDTARKSSGSYYTPRPIVEYMVTESLKQYLISKTNIKEEKISNIFNTWTFDDEILISLEEAKNIKSALFSLKIIDPACGSGAFPMGILHKVLNAHLKIDEIIGQEAEKESKEKSDENLYISIGEKIIYNPDDNLNIECKYLGKYEFNLKIEEKNDNKIKVNTNLKVNDLTLSVKHFINFYNSIHNKKTIANLFSQGSIEGKSSFNTLRSKNNFKRIVSKDEEIILWEYKEYKVENKTRSYRNEDDENYMSNEYSYSKYLYNLKKQIIQNSIYGVDIQPIAVDISRLRTFLSLIVDEKVNDAEENRGIESLPNLEFNFVCANSLIELPSGDNKGLWQNIFIPKLKEIRNIYFSISDSELKFKLKNEYLEILEDLKKDFNDNTFDKNKSMYNIMIAQWNPFSDEPADWFDPEWMFGEKGGFDIVIANPPYLQLQRLKGNPIQEEYKKQKFKVYDANGDIYCLFYEEGIDLLNDKGILTYITSNKWMRAGYGEKLREYFLSYSPLILIDLGSGVFESATVDTNILIIQKNKSIDSNSKLNAITLNKSDDDNINISDVLKTKGLYLSNLSKEVWFIGSNKEQKLKEKIEKIGIPLKQWNVNIYRGIVTGLNEAFIIDQETKDRLVSEDSKSLEVIKPILRGRDIKRYCYDWAKLYILFIPWHFPLHNDSSIQGASDKSEKEFKKKYPAIYKYLSKFKEQLLLRNKSETGIRYEWYALQRCAASYLDEFEKNKIIYPNMTKFLPFIHDTEKFYINQKCFIITSDSNILKYLTGYLNSKYSHKWIQNNCPELQGGTRELSKIFFENIPVPKITSSNRQIVDKIESFVDKILNGKKQNPETDTTELEKQIDMMVYQLYDLTDEEIGIVEGESEQ